MSLGCNRGRQVLPNTQAAEQSRGLSHWVPHGLVLLLLMLAVQRLFKIFLAAHKAPAPLQVLLPCCTVRLLELLRLGVICSNEARLGLLLLLHCAHSHAISFVSGGLILRH